MDRGGWWTIVHGGHKGSDEGGDVKKEAGKLDLKSPRAGSFSLMGEGLPLALSAELPLGWASGAVCGMHECADKQRRLFLVLTRQ